MVAVYTAIVTERFYQFCVIHNSEIILNFASNMKNVTMANRVISKSMLLLCLFLLNLSIPVMLIVRPSASSSFVMATPAVTLSRVIKGSNNHQRIFWNLHEDEEETLVDRKVDEEKIVPAIVNHHVRWKSLQHSLRNQDQHPPAIVNSHHRKSVSFILPK